VSEEITAWAGTTYSYEYPSTAVRDAVGQRFSVVGDWDIEDVRLQMYTGAGSTITVHIYDRDNGNPDTSLGSKEVDASGWGAFPSFHVITFDTPISVSTGNYVIVVTEDTQSGTKWRESTGGAGPGGAIYTDDDGSTWNNTGTPEKTLGFKVWGTASLSLPTKATNPSPANEATSVDFSDLTLSWDDGGDADTFDVYIGPVGDLTRIALAQAGTTKVVDTEDVPWGETIYWRVDATNTDGTTTGDTWSFENVVIQGIGQGAGGDFIVAAAKNGVYLSTDLGENWTKKTPDAVGTTDWTKGICSSTGTYIVVVSDANAIYRSANGGSSWAEITPADGDTFSVSDLAMSDDGQYMVIVGQNSTDATESCYISTNYGVSWTAKKPVAASIAYTGCSISNDGSDIAVCTTSYLYISVDSGATWQTQNVPASAEYWACPGLSGDGTTGILVNTNDNNDVFVGVKADLYSEATWAETAVTSAGRALLDDTTAAAQASTIGVGIEDSPQFTGATISGLTANSLVCPSAGGVLASLGAATNGQLPIGSTGAAPSLAVLTQGTGITVSNSAGSITIASTISQYTNEMAQDSVGGILDDGTVGNIVFTYDDAGGVISAATQDGEIDHDSLSNVHQDVNTDASPTFARLSIDGVGTYIDTDGSNNMTLTDAVVGTRTLKQLGCPTYKYIKVTAQAEGDLHLSDGTYWAISKSLIKYIRVVTDSTAWDLYILQNDNGYVANDATIPRMKIGDNVIGNATLWLDLPYEDEDASEEVHLYWVDNSGTNTATFIIQAIELL